jgi:hypothetical protein
VYIITPASSVRLWNPVGFCPEDYLPADLHRYADFARFLVHRIVYGQIFKSYGLKLNGLVPLKSAYVRRFYPDKNLFPAIREHLWRAGAILWDRHYLKGEESMGYGLSAGLAAQAIREVEATHPVLLRKYREYRADGREVEDAPGAVGLFNGVAMSELDRHLKGFFQGLEIDYPRALEWVTSGPHEQRDITILGLLRDRQIFFNRCDYGRVHTNLTNLRSDLRQFLTYQGMSLVNLDLKNSQPLIFASVLNEIYPGDQPPDVKLYIDLVQRGEFYEYVMSAHGVPVDPEKRAKFKQGLYAQAFYGKNEQEGELTRVFADLFPSV